MTRWSAIAAMLVVLSAGFAAAAVSDAWITTKAKMSLLTTEGVSVTDVNVDTTNGEVTLHGKLRSADEKAKAEAAVRRIDGVRNVRNLLQVVPDARAEQVAASDEELKRRAEQAIRDAGLRDVSVQSVNAGVVLLKGDVRTLSDHLRAVETASRVPGVKRVASEIESPDKLADQEIYSDRPQTAGAGATMSDMWITSAVKLRLMADSRTPGLGVNVDTTNGTVTLFGIVPSETAKQAAEEDAKKVSGVKTVDNELQVVPKAQQDAVAARDDEVEDRVESAIDKQDGLSDVKIEVKNGIVRLTGSVASQADRLRAAVTARTTTGVRAVEDDLRVSGDAVSSR
jgi:hyperosmotically inducible protein